jgi:2-methylcitrate dehydratase
MNTEELLLSRLASHVAALSRSTLSEPVMSQARFLLLDTIGCALAGRSHPAVAKSASAAGRLFRGAEARGLGTGRRYGVLGALLDSGTAIRALDLNDFYWGPGVGGHPSDLFAAVLAVAEWQDADLGAALAAAVCGYEVYLRLVDLLPGDGAWDHTTAMTLGASAVTACLLGQDAAQMADTFSLAAVRGPALAAMRYGQISEAKASAPASAAISGVIAAELAAAGIGGPGTSLEGPRGLGALCRPGASLESLASPDNFGRRILDVGIKRYPCIGTAQAAVAAAIELRAKLAGRQPREIHFRLADDGITRHQTTDAYRRPDRRETADHSFYSLIALGLADGELTAHQFESGRFREPDVHALADKLRFTCDLPGARTARLPAQATATLADGSVVSADVEFAPGHPRNPLDAQGVAAKFGTCVRGVMEPEAARNVVHACLEARPDTPVRRILSLLPGSHAA